MVPRNIGIFGWYFVLVVLLLHGRRLDSQPRGGGGDGILGVHRDTETAGWLNHNLACFYGTLLVGPTLSYFWSS